MIQIQIEEENRAVSINPCQKEVELIECNVVVRFLSRCCVNLYFGNVCQASGTAKMSRPWPPPAAAAAAAQTLISLLVSV